MPSRPTCLALFAAALAVGCAVACTSGTTPDCSDAKCGVVSEASVGEGGDDGSDDGASDATVPETGGHDASEASTRDSGAPADASEAGDAAGSGEGGEGGEAGEAGGDSGPRDAAEGG